MTKPVIHIFRFYWKGFDYVGFRFSYNSKIISIIKQIKGIKWSSSNRVWYLPVEFYDQNKIYDILHKVAILEFKEFDIKTESEKNKKSSEILKSYIDHLELKRYSENTKKIYISYFKSFMEFFSKAELENINKEQINKYILHLIRTKNISVSQQNQRINAIKFYYEKVLGQKKEYYNIERPRKSKKLPKVLSEHEVLSILKVTKNLKHKAILSIIYSAGLRRSEVINLRKQDLDFEKKNYLY